MVSAKDYYSHSRAEMLVYIPKDVRKVLEIGCGEGLFGDLLKKHTSAEVWGIEINKEVSEKAAGKLDKVLTGDFLDCLPQIPVGYFDCIVFNDVLEHFTYPDVVLAKCCNLLKSGGYVVSSIPNVRYIGNLKELLFEKDWRYKKEGGILDYTHFRFFTKKSIKRLFEEAGYEIMKIEGLKNNMKSLFYLINFFALFQFSDSRYSQFACVAKVKAK